MPENSNFLTARAGISKIVLPLVLIPASIGACVSTARTDDISAYRPEKAAAEPYNTENHNQSLHPLIRIAGMEFGFNQDGSVYVSDSRQRIVIGRRYQLNPD